MKQTNENPNGQSPLLAAISREDMGIPSGSCLLQRVPDPFVMVIAGASGDLTARKIMPSLYNLYQNGDLPLSFVILGCGRTRLSDDEFRTMMKDACLNRMQMDASKWRAFSASLHYFPVDYSSPDHFETLAGVADQLDKKAGIGGNRLLYLAVPPSLYELNAEMLGRAGLSTERQKGIGWSRIVVEKPFGRDLSSAMELDRRLHAYFREHQIFRIDHYLAKETVQNILMFRFANAIFEPIWNRNYIDHVHILAAESLGVEHRAGYYEQAGVLRDMFQNHMMQLLSLTAMEPPSLFEAKPVGDEKVKVYRSLRPFPVENVNDYLVLGQYGAGSVDGKPAPGYRDEPGVDPQSLTPTFAMMKLFLDNWRWKGVPFYLSSGKRMAEKRTEINIQFKDVPHSMFRQTLAENIVANRLILGVYPDEKISMTFQTKKPGFRVCLRSVTMDFNYHQDGITLPMDAYEKVLLDCMLGDQMLFWRQDGVELCWSFLTPILETCETCGARAESLKPYDAGTWGPKGFEDLRRIR
jgi:glucose-6-phosphate 1-dehydrogenase